MATYDATREVNVLLASGMTIKSINQALGYTAGAVTEDGQGGYDVSGKRLADKLAMLAAAAPKPAAPTEQDEAPATGEPMATERQVAYALTLARRNAAGSLDITGQALRAMTRREISKVIDSLRTEW